MTETVKTACLYVNRHSALRGGEATPQALDRSPCRGEPLSVFAEGALPAGYSFMRLEAAAQWTMSDCGWLQSPSPALVTARYLNCTVAPGVWPAMDVLD